MGSPRIEVSVDAIRSSTRLRAEKSIRNAMFRAGILISNEIKVNLRNNGMIETGKLLQSIGFNIEGGGDDMTLTIGSFNNAYAHINEFGSNNVTDRMRRAMFARMREEGVPRKPGKNVMIGNTFRGRPYMGPALHGQSDRIMAFLRDAIREFDLNEVIS
jgi:hypothetical protein